MKQSDRRASRALVVLGYIQPRRERGQSRSAHLLPLDSDEGYRVARGIVPHFHESNVQMPNKSRLASAVRTHFGSVRLRVRFELYRQLYCEHLSLIMSLSLYLWGVLADMSTNVPGP